MNSMKRQNDRILKEELPRSELIRIVAGFETRYAEEAEVEWFYEDLQDLLELTPKKDVLSL